MPVLSSCVRSFQAFDLGHVALNRTWSQAQFSLCPQYLLACTFGNGETRNLGMDFLRNLDEGLKTIHRLLQTDADGPLGMALQALLKDCAWSSSQLVLEAIQTARNCAFDATDEEWRELCFSVVAGPSNTKHTAEDVFAHLTHCASRSQKGQLRMSK